MGAQPLNSQINKSFELHFSLNVELDILHVKVLCRHFSECYYKHWASTHLTQACTNSRIKLTALTYNEFFLFNPEKQTPSHP